MEMTDPEQLHKSVFRIAVNGIIQQLASAEQIRIARPFIQLYSHIPSSSGISYSSQTFTADFLIHKPDQTDEQYEENIYRCASEMRRNSDSMNMMQAQHRGPLLPPTAVGDPEILGLVFIYSPYVCPDGLAIPKIFPQNSPDTVKIIYKSCSSEMPDYERYIYLIQTSSEFDFSGFGFIYKELICDTFPENLNCFLTGFQTGQEMA